MKLTSIFASTFAAAIISAGMLACSGTTSTGGTSGSVTGAGNCSTLATAACGKLNTCLGAAVVTGFYGDSTACATALAADCTNSATLAGSTFATSGAKCEAAYSAATCDDITGNLGAATFDACGKGSLATATACITDVQCSTGFCKAKDPASSSKCGACADILAEGADCKDSCGGASLVCVAGKCAKYVAIGAACGDLSAPCAGLAYCSGAGVCTARVAKGAACDTKTQNCASGLFCGANGCEDLKNAKIGDPCGIVDGAYVGCSASRCKITGSSGVCEAFAAKGEACGTGTSDKRCVQPYECISGKCGFEDPSTCK